MNEDNSNKFDVMDNLNILSRQIEWRLYFGDGSTWDSGQGLPVPDKFVQIVVIRKEDGKRGLIHFHDWYWLEDGVWYGSDIFSMATHQKVNAPAITCVRQGYTLLDRLYKILYTRASKDPDFK